MTQPSALPMDLREYIAVFSGALEPETCAALLADCARSRWWNTATVGTGRVRTGTRNCDTLGISSPHFIKDKPEIRIPMARTLDRTAQQILVAYKERFPAIHTLKTAPFELLRYHPGGFYKHHVDHSDSNPRAVTLLIQINDDFEGGTLSFFNGQFELRLRQGDALLFPSSFMFPHAVRPVTSGVRYTLVSWIL
ncbi:MAG: 2OG-Fe(II) oxygenase family protein [Gammaproteobacteria bacterium]